VSQKKLDLLQLPSGCVAQLCTGATKIMRSGIQQAELGSIVLDHAPDYFLRDAVAPVFAGPTDAAKQPSG
jgi:hypothetical protein